MRKVGFLISALCLCSIGCAIEQVKFRWERPLDFRGNGTARVSMDALHALPLGGVDVVLTRWDDFAPFRSLSFANLASSGALNRFHALTPGGVDQHRFEYSCIDTTGRLYLASDANHGGYWHRFGQTGSLLATRVHQSPVSSMVAHPFGTTFSVGGTEQSGWLAKADMYGSVKWANPFPNAVGNTTSRSFLDTQGNVNFIASGVDAHFLTSSSFVRKVSPDGTTLLHVPLPLSGNEVIVDAGRDKDGNYVALVDRYSANNTYTTLRKFRTADGAELWSKEVAFNSDPAMALDGQGRTWIIRRTSTFTGEVIQYSKSGAVNWSSGLPTFGPIQLTLDTSDEGYVAGSSQEGKAVMVKFAGNGLARFAHSVPGIGGRRSGSAISVDSRSGDIYLGIGFLPDGGKSYPLIRCLAQAPYVRNDSYPVPANQSTLVGPVIGNDSFTLNAGLTIVRGPRHGSLPYVGQDGMCTYQPNAGFTGQDSFTYRLNRGTLQSYTATVLVNVQ